MQIRLLGTLARPDGIFVGEVNLPQNIALALVESGQATALEPMPEVVPEADPKPIKRRAKK